MSRVTPHLPRGVLTLDALRARCAIDPVSHCWNWLGGLSNGYPRVHTLDYARMEKRAMNGPAAAWSIAHGEALPAWPAQVFRGCGNRLCLNPAHLRLAERKADVGEHQRRAGYLVGTATEARRANVLRASAASGKVATAPDVVLAIRAEDRATTSSALAARFSMAVQTVSRIRRGESHRHLLEAAA